MGNSTAIQRGDKKDLDVALPPLVLVVQALLWSKLQLDDAGNEIERKPVAGYPKVRCVIFHDEAEIGHTLEYPSTPVVIPRGPAKAKVVLRFFPVASTDTEASPVPAQPEPSEVGSEAGSSPSAEVRFTLADLIPLGVPLYTSLWLGMAERNSQANQAVELFDALVKARDMTSPKVAITLFKPAPSGRPGAKGTSAPGTPAPPQPDVDGILMNLQEGGTTKGMDFGCNAASRSRGGPSVHDQVKGLMEAVKVANTITYALQQAAWRQQLDSLDPLVNLKLNAGVPDMPLEEVERALRKSRETDHVLQEKYGKKFECTQSALEKALKANSDLEIEREEIKARSAAEIDKLQTDLEAARQESNHSFQRSNGLLADLESVRAELAVAQLQAQTSDEQQSHIRSELAGTQKRLQAADEQQAVAHQQIAKLDEEVMLLRQEVNAESATGQAASQELVERIREKETFEKEAQELGILVQNLQAALSEEQGNCHDVKVKLAHAEERSKALAGEIQDIHTAHETERSHMATASAAVKELQVTLETTQAASQAERDRLEAKRVTEVRALNTEIASLQTAMAAGGSRAEAQVAASETRANELAQEAEALREALDTERQQRREAAARIGSLEAETQTLRATLDEQTTTSRKSLTQTNSQVESLMIEIAQLKLAREEDAATIASLTTEGQLQSRQLENLKEAKEQERKQLEAAQEEAAKLLGEIAKITADRDQALQQVEAMVSENNMLRLQMQDMDVTAQKERLKLTETAEKNAALVNEIAQMTSARDAEVHRVMTLTAEAAAQARELETLRQINTQERELCTKAREEGDRLREEVIQLTAHRAHEAQRADGLKDESRQRSLELDALREARDQERENCAKAREEGDRLRDEVRKLTTARAQEAQRADALQEESRQQSREFDTLRGAYDQERELCAKAREDGDRVRDELSKMTAARAQEAQRADALQEESQQRSRELDTLREACDQEKSQTSKAREEADQLREEISKLSVAHTEEERALSSRAQEEADRLREEISKLTEARAEEAQRAETLMDEGRKRSKELATLREATDQERNLSAKVRDEAARLREEISKLATARAEEAARSEQLLDEGRERNRELESMKKTSEEERLLSARNREEVERLKDDIRDISSARAEENAKAEKEKIELQQEAQQVKEQLQHSMAAKDDELVRKEEEVVKAKQELQMKCVEAEEAIIAKEQAIASLQQELHRLQEEEMPQLVTAAKEEAAARAKEAVAVGSAELSVASEKVQMLSQKVELLASECREQAEKIVQLEQENVQLEQDKQAAKEILGRQIEQVREDGQLEAAKQVGQLQSQLEEERLREAQNSSQSDHLIDQYKAQIDRASHEVQALEDQLHTALEDAQAADGSVARLREELRQERETTETLRQQAITMQEQDLNQLQDAKRQLEDQNEQLRTEVNQLREDCEKEQHKSAQEAERRRHAETSTATGKQVADLRLQLQKAKQAHKEELARYQGVEPGLKMLEQQKEVHSEQVATLQQRIEKLEDSKKQLQQEAEDLKNKALQSRDKLTYLKNLVGRQQDVMEKRALASPSSSAGSGMPMRSIDSFSMGASMSGASAGGWRNSVGAGSDGQAASPTRRNSITAARSRLGGLMPTSDPALPTAMLGGRGSVIVVPQGRSSSKVNNDIASKDVLALRLFRKLISEKCCQLTAEDLNKALKLDTNPAFIQRADLNKVIKRAEGLYKTFTVKKAFLKFDPHSSGKVNGDQFKQAMETTFKVEGDTSHNLWLLILFIIREPTHPLFPWSASKKGGSGGTSPHGDDTLTEGEFTKLMDHPRLIPTAT